MPLFLCGTTPIKIQQMQYGAHSQCPVLLQKKKMKHILLSIAVLSLLAASCKKSSSTSTTPSSSVPSNGWKLGTVSYSTVLSARSGGNLLSAFDAVPSGSNPSVNTFIVYFSALPTTGGTFHIVHYPAASLASNEIGVAAAIYATSADYLSTGSDGIDATVTITAGKIKVVVPTVWVKKTSGTDSLQLTGTLIEQ